MNRVTLTLIGLLLATSAPAQTPAREGATQIWKVTHPKTGSVATPVRSGPATLIFPYAPIISGKNIDLPPRISTPKGEMLPEWTQWTIPAWIKIELTLTNPTEKKPHKRVRFWRLFARLKDGRIVEASKEQYGTSGGSYSGDGVITQHLYAQFKLTTNVATRKEFEKKQRNPEIGVGISGNPADIPEKQTLWREVTELWFFEK